MAALFSDSETFEKVLDRSIRSSAKDLINTAADILGCEEGIRSNCNHLMSLVRKQVPGAKFDFRPEVSTGHFIFQVYVTNLDDRYKVERLIFQLKTLKNNQFSYGKNVTCEVGIGYLS